MIRVLRDTVFSKMKFFSFLSLTFNFDIKFQYIKTCIPPTRWSGVRESLGIDKIMGFYISPHLMFSITFVFVMHFHNHLCISMDSFETKIDVQACKVSYCLFWHLRSAIARLRHG